MLSNKLKISIVVLLASIAAIGTIPYGFQFAKNVLIPKAGLITFVVGCLLAASAATANAILGSYSLLKINFKDTTLKYSVMLVILSTVNALVMGFMCYFGYAEILPATINVTISCIVTIINAGIGYTALNNLFMGIKEIRNQKITRGEMITRIMAIYFGLIGSVVAYLTASNGLATIFHDQWQISNSFKISYLLAIFAWVPFAALFSNSAQIVAKQLYDYLKSLFKNGAGISLKDIGLIIFSLASGSALAQATLNFFNPDGYIPNLFKTAFMQALAYPFFMPIVFLISAAVNYFALKESIKIFASLSQKK